jgi:hypothetical protein
MPVEAAMMTTMEFAMFLAMSFSSGCLQNNRKSNVMRNVYAMSFLLIRIRPWLTGEYSNLH